MTLAIDKRTDEVIGQVLPLWNRPLSEWPLGGDYGPERKIRLLTKHGYRDADAASVRLERMGD